MDITLTKAGINVLLANGKNLIHVETKNKLRSLLSDAPSQFLENKEEVAEVKAPPKPWTSPAVPGLIQPIWKMFSDYEDLKRRVQNLEKVFFLSLFLLTCCRKTTDSEKWKVCSMLLLKVELFQACQKDI
jgi:hypothetical protein